MPLYITVISNLISLMHFMVNVTSTKLSHRNSIQILHVYTQTEESILINFLKAIFTYYCKTSLMRKITTFSEYHYKNLKTLSYGNIVTASSIRIIQ